MPPRPAPSVPLRPLSRVSASMVSGLPEPQSQEARDWMRDALASLQREDPRPDVDLGTIEERLRAIEALPGAPDLSGVWEALGALASRLNAAEDGLAALVLRISALEGLRMIEAALPPVVTLDPLDPRNWSDVAAAKAALLVLVTREAALRCGHAVELYEEMTLLDAKGDARTRDDDLRLLQHESWAKERTSVELARLTHNAAIARLESVEDAARYDWRAGWPVLESRDDAPLSV